MRILIIIPCHNESAFIKKTLDSLLNQTLLAQKIIVVDDNSTDDSASIIRTYANVHEPVEYLFHQSAAHNIPGSKVIAAFHYGLNHADLSQYDAVAKYDADLIFPLDYLELVTRQFHDKTCGMAAGHCTILKDNQWILEKGTNKDHIRGALKLYTTDCFDQIGGLKESIGWDTVDEMLARFYGWNVVTVSELHVKHLKLTGAAYDNKARYLQGEAFYKMRYGWWLTAITAGKIAWNKKSLAIIKDYLKGYKLAKTKNLEPLVTAAQGKFIRNYRWRGILNKVSFKN